MVCPVALYLDFTALLFTCLYLTMARTKSAKGSDPPEGVLPPGASGEDGDPAIQRREEDVVVEPEPPSRDDSSTVGGQEDDGHLLSSQKSQRLLSPGSGGSMCKIC